LVYVGMPISIYGRMHVE
ncbi:hypothetical protein BAE44_0002285, partial [Dichanthelium oligosanthes]